MAIALTLFAMNAWSIGSSSSSAPNSVEKKPDTAQVDTRGRPGDMRLAKTSPTPVELVKAPAVAVESVEGAKQMLSPEWALVWATAVLALITLGLAWYTARLYKATVALGEEAKNTSAAQDANTKAALAISKEAADAAKASAEAAHKQFLMLGEQADIAEKQRAMLRIQFIAEHRPKLIIRNITIHRPIVRDGEKLPLFFRQGEMISGSLTVVNSGETDAKIIGGAYRFFWSEVGLPMSPPIGHEVSSLFGTDAITISGKESRTISVKSIRPMDQFAERIFDGSCKLYVMGVIKYSDINEKERLMGFCREYRRPSINGGEGSFRPVDNPDYEYED